MNDVREEKITLGITTLLSMSILILMVSDKMPSTSSFIPLIGELKWTYTNFSPFLDYRFSLWKGTNVYQSKFQAGSTPSWSCWYHSPRWPVRPWFMCKNRWIYFKFYYSFTGIWGSVNFNFHFVELNFQGLSGNRPDIQTMRWARRIGRIIRMELPLLMKEAYAAKARVCKLKLDKDRLKHVFPSFDLLSISI